ncbi:hypothetical protein D3C85_1480110 [compost metagenome]
MLLAVFDVFVDFLHRLRPRPGLFKLSDLQQCRRGEQQILPLGVPRPGQPLVNQHMPLLVEFQHGAHGVRQGQHRNALRQPLSLGNVVDVVIQRHEPWGA